MGLLMENKCFLLIVTVISHSKKSVKTPNVQVEFGL